MKNMFILVLCFILGIGGGVAVNEFCKANTCNEDVCCCDEEGTGTSEEAKKKCARHCKCDKCKDGCKCKKEGNKCSDACKCVKK